MQEGFDPGFLPKIAEGGGGFPDAPEVKGPRSLAREFSCRSEALSR
jgi:hypothetical protein